ncbi:hypothetical protein SCLCIDRAFT_387213 [Scleroderma citrinum Foug A]|uniref:Uncharacterized protein n=1 Tax=Scleroderma citrinum Foug A TaxID=1036808 RepID=A0A0C2YXF9_9AGAM|nr:hypothetical protein SCLCIDRAFT_387213 [Scleroderma citrinum Foug A]
MTNNQSNNRRSKRKPWKTKPIQGTTGSQLNLSHESSPTINSTIPQASSEIPSGKSSRLKNLLSFNWSNRSIASSSARMCPSVEAEIPELLNEVWNDDMEHSCPLNTCLVAARSTGGPDSIFTSRRAARVEEQHRPHSRTCSIRA